MEIQESRVKLEQGIMTHGFPDEKCRQLVKEIQERTCYTTDHFTFRPR
jgi:hypothetical protein